MENKNSFEQAFKPLLTNSEIQKMEFYRGELQDNWKDVYWSLSIPDLEIIVNDYRKKSYPMYNIATSLTDKQKEDDARKNELLERYKYRLEYIEAVHIKKIAEIDSSKPTHLTGQRATNYQSNRYSNENERYGKELKKYYRFISELVEYYDFPEIEHEFNDVFTTNTKTDEMTKRGYQCIAIYDITDHLAQGHNKKLYKFKLKENETIHI